MSKINFNILYIPRDCNEKIMSKLVKLLCFLVITGITGITGGAIIGCASTAANLQKETARSIGGNIRPEQVNISSIERGVIDVKWKASAPTGNYDCSADDMVRRVDCKKK
ncbi:MAG: hypothetical protein PHG36_02630 [Dehalococcoidia bacterium]|nr:hypothetical protein [Dehalococcoidia bacterium]